MPRVDLTPPSDVLKWKFADPTEDDIRNNGAELRGILLVDPFGRDWDNSVVLV
jgi:hypothetical protein